MRFELLCFLLFSFSGVLFLLTFLVQVTCKVCKYVEVFRTFEQNERFQPTCQLHQRASKNIKGAWASKPQVGRMKMLYMPISQRGRVGIERLSVKASFFITRNYPNRKHAHYKNSAIMTMKIELFKFSNSMWLCIKKTYSTEIAILRLPLNRILYKKTFYGTILRRMVRRVYRYDFFSKFPQDERCNFCTIYASFVSFLAGICKSYKTLVRVSIK